MATIVDTARIVGQVRHPSIKIQLDTGLIAINREDIHDILPDLTGLIGHIRISARDLLPVDDENVPHPSIGYILGQYLPEYIVTLEMRTGTGEAHLRAIECALRYFTIYYRPELSALPSWFSF